jgi:hypothetical protein
MPRLFHHCPSLSTSLPLFPSLPTSVPPSLTHSLPPSLPSSLSLSCCGFFFCAEARVCALLVVGFVALGA